LEFILWKIQDHRYQQLLIPLAKLTLDMYFGVFGLDNKIDTMVFKDLSQAIEE